MKQHDRHPNYRRHRLQHALLSQVRPQLFLSHLNFRYLSLELQLFLFFFGVTIGMTMIFVLFNTVIEKMLCIILLYILALLSLDHLSLTARR